MYLAGLVSSLARQFSADKVVLRYPGLSSACLTGGGIQEYVSEFIRNLLMLFLNPYKKVPAYLQRELAKEIEAFLSRVQRICTGVQNDGYYGQENINF